jgi:hypothetical protein
MAGSIDVQPAEHVESESVGVFAQVKQTPSSID